MDQTGGGSPASVEKPFYQRASFWTGPFTIGIGLLLATGLALGWYELGGFPRDHDRYGEVEVPGQAVLALPEGDVRLNFENHASDSGDSTSLDDQPPGLAVQVSPAGGGEQLTVDDVPSWIFSSTSGNRGHEPFGKVDVPADGDYVVTATTDRSGRSKPEAGGGAGSAAEPPTVDSGPAISVGQSPWTPFDSRLAGAIVCFVVVMLAVVVLFVLPFRLLIPRD